MTYIILIFILIILFVIINYYRKYSINYIIDPFFDRMSPYDLIAYGAINSKDLKNKYIQSISNFNKTEEKELNNNVIIADNIISRYIKSTNSEFSKLLTKLKDINIDIKKQTFIKYPHTLGKTIFTPFVINPKTIVHEKIHILQRLYKKEIQSIYYNDGYIPSDLKFELKRNNPDNDDIIYTINNNPIVCLYNSTTPKNIDDVHNMIDDHPNEIYAYKYADIISKL